ncbi:hypothetical protein [Brevundimonas sp. SPF441]|uniref:hypothetical protein n=1 Tax=Brevundimonas sp. SPF441 TaxID=2663795 RepID=UPI0018928C8E|nr:hypothetical protein [Brevundimonas sp. SPF441]
MTARFSIRPDTDGWTVFDLWTGQPAEIDGALQVGLDLATADDLADLLSNRQDLADN